MGSSQHQLAGQVKGIEDEDDGVGLGGSRHFALEDIDGHAGIFGVGRERVDTGQVDEGEVVAADAGHKAHALFDGDAGVVGYFLAQASQAIEKSGLSRVGRADKDNGLECPGGMRSLGGLEGGCLAAGAHRPTSRSSGVWVGVARCRPPWDADSLSGVRTRMESAVSWRRAISIPSI